jgi:hypothetical protein
MLALEAWQRLRWAARVQGARMLVVRLVLVRLVAALRQGVLAP